MQIIKRVNDGLLQLLELAPREEGVNEILSWESQFLHLYNRAQTPSWAGFLPGTTNVEVHVVKRNPTGSGNICKPVGMGQANLVLLRKIAWHHQLLPKSKHPQASHPGGGEHAGGSFSGSLDNDNNQSSHKERDCVKYWAECITYDTLVSPSSNLF